MNQAVSARPELQVLAAVGGTLAAEDLGPTAERLRREAGMTFFDVLPANGAPARSPALARALALAVVDGLVRLDGGTYVLTQAGQRALVLA